MNPITHRLRGLVGILAVAMLSTSGLDAAVEITGRLVDGSAMLREPGALANVTMSGFSDTAARVPIADTTFRLSLAEHGASWTGTTDADGRFAIELTGFESVGSHGFVASVQDAARGRPSHHSLPVQVEAGEEAEFRLYNTSESTEFLKSGQLGVVYSLEFDEATGVRALRTRVTLLVNNVSGDLFVGKRIETASGRDARVCFRLPLPHSAESGVRIQENETHGGAAAFTVTPDGWVILDSPIPPYPEAPQGARYDIDFLMPAAQEMVFAFPLDIPLEQMYVLGVKEDIGFPAEDPPPGVPGLRKAGSRMMPDPDTRRNVQWEILLGKDLQPGSTIPVALTADSMLLGQVNHGSLRVVCGFVVGAIIAVLVGLVLGRYGPRVERVLADASGEEIIERIAQLDAQHRRGLIQGDAYHATRERLLSLARYEVPELARAAAPSAAAAAGGIPPEAVRLSQRILELDAAGSADPKAIQERVLLLEQLARVIAGAETARAVSDAGGPKQGSAEGAS